MAPPLTSKGSDSFPGCNPAAGAASHASSAPVPPPCLRSLLWRRCPAGDRSGTAAFAVRALGQETQPVRTARRFAEATLCDWDMEGAIGESVAVIASEMVTNALNHGLAGALLAPSSPPPVWMSLLRQGATVLCAVFDPGDEVPVVKEPDYLAESGRGLHIVASLSDAWGWIRFDPRGKAVWATTSAGDA